MRYFPNSLACNEFMMASYSFSIMRLSRLSERLDQRECYPGHSVIESGLQFQELVFQRTVAFRRSE